MTCSYIIRLGVKAESEVTILAELEYGLQVATEERFRVLFYLDPAKT